VNDRGKALSVVEEYELAQFQIPEGRLRCLSDEG